MNRKEFAVNLGLLSIGAALFGKLPKASSSNRNFHFVGLGNGMNESLNRLQVQFPNSSFTQFGICSKQHNGINYIDFETKLSKNQLMVDDKGILNSIPKGFYEKLAIEKETILLCGLGGCTGTYLLKWFSKKLANDKRTFKVFAHFPFKFEGKRRIERAQQLTAHLNNGFHHFALEDKRLQWGNLKLKDAFNRADAEMVELVMGKIK